MALVATGIIQPSDYSVARGSAILKYHEVYIRSELSKKEKRKTIVSPIKLDSFSNGGWVKAYENHRSNRHLVCLV